MSKITSMRSFCSGRRVRAARRCCAVAGQSWRARPSGSRCRRPTDAGRPLPLRSRAPGAAASRNTAIANGKPTTVTMKLASSKASRQVTEPPWGCASFPAAHGARQPPRAAAAARNAGWCRRERCRARGRPGCAPCGPARKRVEQVGVVLQEHLAHAGVAEQERAEGLREHVLRPDRVPDLARQSLPLRCAASGTRAEVAVGEVLDLVVVVEHHLAVARDAEVLPQHVAGEDVGGHQVLDGVAVLDHRATRSAAGRRRAGRCSAGSCAARCRRDGSPARRRLPRAGCGQNCLRSSSTSSGSKRVRRERDVAVLRACRPCGRRGRAS